MTIESVDVEQLAKLVDGMVVGDGSLLIARLQAIEAAETGDIAFLANSTKTDVLASSRASAVIVPMDMEPSGKTVIKVKNPYLASAIIHNHLLAKPFAAKGIHEDAHVGSDCRISDNVTIEATAFIGDNVTIGERVHIYPGVYVGNDVKIGDDTVIRSNVTIEYECLIGSRVIIHSGTVVGSDGYGYAADERGCHIKRPQVGIVRIDDDVEIGANCCLDRATYGLTWVKSGAKLDNLVHIAHNVVVGENSLLLGHVGIAGSTTLGRNVVFGGKSGAKGHIEIGDRVMVAAMSGVTRNQPPGVVLGGMPAIPVKRWAKAAATYGKVPDLRAEVRRLSKEVEKLQNLLSEKK